jgi:hypothetical protein
MHPMTIPSLLALGLCVLAVVLLARSGPVALGSWRIYAGTGRRHQEDAGLRAPVMPPGVQDRMAILAESGYHEIGVTRLELPDGERFAWILAAGDAESYIILAGGLSGVPLTGIYSAWADGTWLGTMHPRGTPIDRGGLHIRIVPTSLGLAVTEHLAGLARIRAVHADPRPVRTLADMLALDLDYRKRFAGTAIRSLTLRNMVPGILSAGALVIAILLLILTWR